MEQGIFQVTITMAAEAGQLELNAFEPIVFYCMFQSIDTLAYAVHTFVENLLDKEQMDSLLDPFHMTEPGTIRGTMDVLNKTL